MPTSSDALRAAVQHHSAGQFQAAEQTCRQILTDDPNHVAALHLLGVIASQLGQHETAVEHIRRAIALNGADAVFHSNLGAVLKDQGKLDEAIACCRRALELKPDLAAAHYNLGNALVAQGKPSEAIESYRRALALKPNFAEAHTNLGTAFLAQDKPHEAIASCQRALDLKPNDATAHCNLGTAFQALEKLDEAVDSFHRALDLKPDLSEAHFKLGTAFQAQGKLVDAVRAYTAALNLKPDDVQAANNLGIALQAQDKLNEAVVCFRKTLELNSDHAETHSNLGRALCALQRFDDAIASYRRALELKPEYVDAHYNLGTALQAQGKLNEAVACYRRTLELKSDHSDAHNNLGTVFNDQGMFDEAVALYRRAIELKPDFAEAWVNLLMALQYRGSDSLSELAAANAEYERLHAAPLRATWRPHENDRNPDRPLRVGFVSPDLGQHPVGYFLIRPLESIDRGQCETICYSHRNTKDELTKRFEAAASIWRDVKDVSDQDLAEQIRADRIDILFDLAGHTSRNRLLLFARKPAPIQVTWAGYAGSTGLAAMDYILADRYEIPPEAEAHFTERVLRMPDGYVCYEPPSYAPEVSPLPAKEHGSVTFGSFNNPAKLTSQIIEVWAHILRRVPRSRLVLKFRGMNYPSIAKKLATEFASHQVDPRRLECLGWSPHEELLSEYHRIDVALDPFPYNGGLTTCEALWMGVPVVTCPGETFASRHSLSHLSNVGFTETIARDFDEYVELAAALANDSPRLAALRASLRPRMAASPLCDGQRFAQNLMHVLRHVWRQWCHQA